MVPLKLMFSQRLEWHQFKTTLPNHDASREIQLELAYIFRSSESNHEGDDDNKTIC